MANALSNSLPHGNGTNGSKEIGKTMLSIKHLAQKSTAKEISSTQGSLSLEVEKEVGGIGMGVLSDGTPYLNQRGLAVMCGVQNAHIGTISTQWTEPDQKPRISSVKGILVKAGAAIPLAAHLQVHQDGRVHYCYPADVCLAVLEYYAFEAGPNCQPEARDNFRRLAGSKLRELIYNEVGYKPNDQNYDRFKPWHERIALNHQSAPKGFFHVFNEAHTLIYELIQAGADAGAKLIVDISIGQHWAKHWTDNELTDVYGERCKYPHRYPDSHPQSKSNPQESWCYPLSALGYYRQWLQDTYIEGGKFSAYVSGKARRGELMASVAEQAIYVVVRPQIGAPGT